MQAPCEGVRSPFVDWNEAHPGFAFKGGQITDILAHGSTSGPTPHERLVTTSIRERAASVQLGKGSAGFCVEGNGKLTTSHRLVITHQL